MRRWAEEVWLQALKAPPSGVVEGKALAQAAPKGAGSQITRSWVAASFQSGSFHLRSDLDHVLKETEDRGGRARCLRGNRDRSGGLSGSRRLPAHPAGCAAARLSPAADLIYKYVKKHPGQFAWQRIPWLVDLPEAIRQSKAENRPVLLFVSGDDPLQRC